MVCSTQPAAPTLAIVTYSCSTHTAGPGELALKIGDVVSNVEKVDSDWYRGTCGGLSGIFPVNHVSVLVSHNTVINVETWELWFLVDLKLGSLCLCFIHSSQVMSPGSIQWNYYTANSEVSFQIKAYMLKCTLY